MKEEIFKTIRLLLVLISLFLFCSYIYPTKYEYMMFQESGTVVKVNRINGDTYFLNSTSKEWTKLTN